MALADGQAYEVTSGGLVPLTLGGVRTSTGLVAPDSYTVTAGAVNPPPPPSSGGAMLLGLGGGTGASVIADNAAALHARGSYQYWTSAADYDWANVCATFPSNWRWYLAASCSTYAVAKAMLDTFPASRPEPVYISFGQELDNNTPYRTGTSPNFVYNGAQYVADSGPLRQAIRDARAAGKTYIYPSVSLMPMTIYQPDIADTFIASDVKHLMMSMYAQVRLDSGGHMVASRDPVTMPRRIGDFAAARGMKWDAAAAGFILYDTEVNDSISRQNRVDWLETAIRNVQLNGGRFFGNFNTRWTIGANPGDYRIQTFPESLSMWNRLLVEFGQVPA